MQVLPYGYSNSETLAIPVAISGIVNGLSSGSMAGGLIITLSGSGFSSNASQVCVLLTFLEHGTQPCTELPLNKHLASLLLPDLAHNG